MSAAPSLEACAATPMGRWLGYGATASPGGLIHTLAFAERHIGNRQLRALHGGVIASFLEFAAETELAARLAPGAAFVIVNQTIDYLSSPSASDLFARVRLIRLGRRLAFFESAAWQTDEAAPVALARTCLRIG